MGVTSAAQAATHPIKKKIKKVKRKKAAGKKARRKAHAATVRFIRRGNWTTVRLSSSGKKRRKSLKLALAKPSTGGLFGRASGQIYSGGRYLGKTTVTFTRKKLKPGSIYINTRERALYYILPGGKALKYGVGVGREGFTWSGRHRISMKKEWPEWRPPEEMKQRELKQYGRKLPDVMPGGPNNPLGARALYIGNTLYRIHGTIAPSSIGKFVSSGCIRMLNSEVIDLYKRVRKGALVVVD
ncbi:MAG TPA: L,D-transpeptidase [Thermopetrobacter sp.]|nr:L,D-transpeptidase [Thermopetrobacter sp.]